MAQHTAAQHGAAWRKSTSATSRLLSGRWAGLCRPRPCPSWAPCSILSAASSLRPCGRSGGAPFVALLLPSVSLSPPHPLVLRRICCKQLSCSLYFAPAPSPLRPPLPAQTCRSPPLRPTLSACPMASLPSAGRSCRTLHFTHSCLHTFAVPPVSTARPDRKSVV